MFEPKIMSFICKWCTYAGADLAGTSRMEYVHNPINVRVMCSSRIDPQHIFYAFKHGADGVFIGGCHPGDCHYVEGNYKTLRRVFLVKKMMRDMGIDPARLRLEWISAAEGSKFVEVMNEFTEQIKNLGPLNFREMASIDEGVSHE
ncbi:methyl-viologen-reducing hydrogenase subunit delta [candidate division KSB1 bacterium]|nr:MAG: methyl-viologen-reducing hydrogenase subunit delta [candidate division KSB1 bacterium]